MSSPVKVNSPKKCKILNFFPCSLAGQFQVMQRQTHDCQQEFILSVAKTEKIKASINSLLVFARLAYNHRNVTVCFAVQLILFSYYHPCPASNSIRLTRGL